MEANFGVNSFIWSENFGLKDLYLFEKTKKMGFDTFDISISNPDGFPILKAREAAKNAGISLIVTNVLGKDANPISPDKSVRIKSIEVLKKLIDITEKLDSKILTGVNYASLGYITGKPRTTDEWSWSVEALRNVAEYALQNSRIIIAFEPINRFETFFLNIAADAVKYCQDIGTSNVAVHLDTFHMIREETSFTEAVKVCGKKYLKHIHLGENNRGIPGTGLVPWTELFTALNDIGYSEAMSIESFDPSFTEINKICAIWRTYAESGEALATEGLKNLKSILMRMTNYNNIKP